LSLLVEGTAVVTDKLTSAGLEMVGTVDVLGALWVTLAFQRGRGQGIALKLLERS